MEADVVISWGFAPVPDSVKEYFDRPTKYVVLPTPPNRAYGAQVQALGWPFPVRTAIQKYLPGVTPMRIAVLGFSESCHGVRNLLNGQDGMYVDSVIAIDGIHTPFVNKNQVDPNTMTPWINHAKYAVVNERLFIGTHSSIVPPGYASTTQTCDYIWRLLTGSDQAFTSPAMPDMSIPPTSVYIAGGPATGKQRTVQYPAPAWQPFKRAGGLVIIGANNVDGPGTADHIYQAKYVLPLVLRELLAARWNAIDPKDPGAVCFVGGPFGSLGSASSNCASSFTVPASFVQSGAVVEPPPPPKTVVIPSGETKKSKALLIAGALVAAGTAGLWWMSKNPQYAFKSNPRKYDDSRDAWCDSGSCGPNAPYRANPVDPEQLRIGTAMEAREHGMSQAKAEKTAREHLAEDDQYYNKLIKMEKGTPMYGWDALVKW